MKQIIREGKLDNNINKSERNLHVKLEPKHKAMLIVIAEYYRLPQSVSHAVRLMIEDKHKEIVELNGT